MSAFTRSWRSSGGNASPPPLDAFSRLSIKHRSRHCAPCFSRDLFARSLEKEEKTGGLWDQHGTHWLIFDVDGTRQAARQRALPSTPDLPPAQRRLDEVCAPGSTSRKRGETVRTRITALQRVWCLRMGATIPLLGSGEPLANRVFTLLDALQDVQAERCRWLQAPLEIVRGRTSFH